MSSLLRSWIAVLSRARVLRMPEHAEAGALVPVDVVLDHVGEDPDVAIPRRWREDCRTYRLRLEVRLQEEIIRREKYEQFLNLLLETER